MPAVICAALALAALGQPADRAAIEQAVRALNAAGTGAERERIANLFTADAGDGLDRLLEWNRRLHLAARRPMSEVTAPMVVIRSVQFITPEVALVDAASTQYGSATPALRLPLLVVMRKETAGWRIAALRVLPAISAAGF
jgi:hypothetical protein